MFKPKKVSMDEKLKEFRLNTRRTMRRINREVDGLNRKELELKKKIREYIKNNEQQVAVNVARDLIRNRHAIVKFHNIIAQLDSIITKVSLMKAEHGVFEALKLSGSMMKSFNDSINLNQLGAIMDQFNMQEQATELKSDMIDGIMDSGTEAEVDNEIASEMVGLFGEMKIEIDDKIHSYITGNEILTAV
jgi:hypothetical protein